MIVQRIKKLEALITELEEKLEGGDSDEFVGSDEFQEMYEAIKEMEERSREDIESLPYADVSEKALAEFDSLRKSLNKCKKRIKKIEDETDVNDGEDSSWMFDGADDDED